MLWNTMVNTPELENQLVLYVADQPPAEDWQTLARSGNWQMLYHNDLLCALGAFVMLMPGIVIIDRRSPVGSEALSHIEDVLHTVPQPLLIIVELGVPDCTTRQKPVVRVGAASDAAPTCILSRIQATIAERDRSNSNRA